MRHSGPRPSDRARPTAHLGYQLAPASVEVQPGSSAWRMAWRMAWRRVTLAVASWWPRCAGARWCSMARGSGPRALLASVEVQPGSGARGHPPGQPPRPPGHQASSAPSHHHSAAPLQRLCSPSAARLQLACSASAAALQPLCSAGAAVHGAGGTLTLTLTLALTLSRRRCSPC